MKYKLIVPSIGEAQITGFIMGAEKQIGKSLWRAEIHRGESTPRVFKNGVQITDENAMPDLVIKTVNKLIMFYENAVNHRHLTSAA